MTTTTIASPVENGSASDEQVVVLRVGGGDYAVPIGGVQEIVRVPPITRVPNAHPSVEGVINLRGKVLPVVDLAARLGLGTAAGGRGARVVVVGEGAEAQGLLVDGVSEVLMIAATDVEPPSDVVSGPEQNAVRGVAKVGERLVLLLDLDTVVGA